MDKHFNSFLCCHIWHTNTNTHTHTRARRVWERELMIQKGEGEGWFYPTEPTKLSALLSSYERDNKSRHLALPGHYIRWETEGSIGLKKITDILPPLRKKSYSYIWFNILFNIYLCMDFSEPHICIRPHFKLFWGTKLFRCKWKKCLYLVNKAILEDSS